MSSEETTTKLDGGASVSTAELGGASCGERNEMTTREELLESRVRASGTLADRLTECARRVRRLTSADF